MELKTFELKEKKEKENIAFYKVTYALTEDNLQALDTIKNNNKDIKEFKILNVSDINMYGNILIDLFKETKQDKYIRYNKNYDEYSRFNFIKELGSSGLEIIDQYSIEKMNKLIGYMIKNLGKNFLSGKNLTQISLPIYVNDERTMLEM